MEPIDPKWYEAFFEGIVLDFWRAALPAERTRAEADFLERALDLRPGARVLDVPCGLGRHALELAARGHRVTGVDQSAQAIEEARRRAADLGLAVRWTRADMRELPAGEPMDAAYCFGNSFGYFDPAGTRSFLAAVSRALKPGARFVLDGGMAAESMLPNLPRREWATVGEILFLEENRYHPAEGCLETTYTFVRGAETVTRTGYQWVFTLREIRSMLDEAGFTLLRTIGSIEGTPFETGGRYVVLVTEKRT